MIQMEKIQVYKTESAYLDMLSFYTSTNELHAYQTLQNDDGTYTYIIVLK